MPKSWPMPTDVLMLLELQMRLSRAILRGDTAEIVAAILGDGLDPAARVGIYRNHAFATLGDALRGTFPVVCRLVDKRFFAYAAHEYLREHRRIHVASSSTAPTSPTFSPNSPRVSNCPIWRTSPASNGP
jgi:hypothetical protein